MLKAPTKDIVTGIIAYKLQTQKKHRELKGRVPWRYARKSDCFVAKDLDGELQYDESETKCLRTLFK